MILFKQTLAKISTSCVLKKVETHLWTFSCFVRGGVFRPRNSAKLMRLDCLLIMRKRRAGHGLDAPFLQKQQLKNAIETILRIVTQLYSYKHKRSSRQTNSQH